MSLPDLWSRMTRLQRSLLTSTLCIGLYALLGFVLVPNILQKQLVEQLAPLTDREVAVGEVHFNPFLMILSVKDFSIESKGEGQPYPFIQWQELYVDFELSSLFHWAWTFKEIRWHAPNVYVQLQQDGHFNFQDIIDRLSAESDVEQSVKEAAEEDEGQIPALRITSFVLSDASVRFKDNIRKGDNVLELSPISFSVNDFSTQLDNDAANDYALKIVGQKGGAFEWDGSFSLQPIESAGRLTLTDIDLSEFVDFYKDQLGFEMPTALLNFSTDYEVFQEPEWGVALSNGRYTINNLKLYDKKTEQKLLDLPLLDIEAVSVNSVKRKALIGKITLKNPTFELEQFKNGQLNIDSALDFSAFNAADKDEEAKSVTVADSSLDLPTSAGNNEIKIASQGANAQENAWYWRINEFLIESLALNFKESSQAQAVEIKLSNFNGAIKNIHSDAREKAELSIQSDLNDGRLNVAAQGTLMPLSIEGMVDLKDFGLSVVQPYIDPIAKVAINKGSLSSSLTYALVTSAKEGEGFQRMQVQGDLSVDDLAIVDKQSKQKFLSWQSVKIKSLDFDVLENTLSINLLSVNKPYVHAELLQDGSNNLEKLLLENKAVVEDDKEEQAAVPEKAFVINIKKQTLKDGKIYFADRTLTPNYITTIDAISGYSTGISNVSGKASEVNIKARVDGHAPVEITGLSNFMADKPMLDMDILFKGIEMSSFTPYSGNYVGYKVKQGQISLTLDYQLKNDRLMGKNHIYINQFDFGDKVKSDQAVNLPVKLAIALLEDSDKKINLDLNIEGDVNDPDFSIKGLLWKVLKNVIVKAVSSPFSLLAGLAGGGDDLNVVEFSEGRSFLQADAAARLEKLSKALKDRPKLNLAVIGSIDAVADVKALKELQLHKAVLLYLQGDGRRQMIDGTNYTVPLPLHDKYVRKGFKRLFDKRIDEETSDLLDAKVLAHSKGKSEEQLADLRFNIYLSELFVTEVVEPQTLLDLANNRALEVKRNLVDVNEVSAERIFISQGSAENFESGAQVLLDLQ